jgi:hypothetical protein
MLKVALLAALTCLANAHLHALEKLVCGSFLLREMSPLSSISAIREVERLGRFMGFRVADAGLNLKAPLDFYGLLVNRGDPEEDTLFTSLRQWQSRLIFLRSAAALQHRRFWGGRWKLSRWPAFTRAEPPFFAGMADKDFFALLQALERKKFLHIGLSSPRTDADRPDPSLRIASENIILGDVLKENLYELEWGNASKLPLIEDIRKLLGEKDVTLDIFLRRSLDPRFVEASVIVSLAVSSSENSE